MNRWMEKLVLVASLSGAFAVTAPAFADTPTDSGDAVRGGPHGHHDGLVAQALALDSLTSQQRAAIEGLAQAKRTARAPVRAAEARVLTTLAQQVEAGALDRQALAPSVQAKESAELSARAAGGDLAQKLHALLTPAQRAQLVDAVEAHQPPGGHRGSGGPLAMFEKHLGLTSEQTAQIASNLQAERQAEGHAGPPDGGFASHGQRRMAWLESFRGDAFTASAASSGGEPAVNHRDQRIEDVLQAALPVLTAEQRGELAGRLRARAAHASRG